MRNCRNKQSPSPFCSNQRALHKKAISFASFMRYLPSLDNTFYAQVNSGHPARGNRSQPMVGLRDLFLGDPDISLAIYTKVTKGTGPVRRLGKIEHGTSGSFLNMFCKPSFRSLQSALYLSLFNPLRLAHNFVVHSLGTLSRFPVQPSHFRCPHIIQLAARATQKRVMEVCRRNSLRKPHRIIIYGKVNYSNRDAYVLKNDEVFLGQDHGIPLSNICVQLHMFHTLQPNHSHYTEHSGHWTSQECTIGRRCWFDKP